MVAPVFMFCYHELMKRIQIAVPEQTYKQAKAQLSQSGLTWQSWGLAKVNDMLSEEIDNFGIPLMEMAVDRDQFMTKIQEKLVGSLRETAFIILAKKNKQTQWVQHKETEVERLRLELLDVFDLESKGKWNKLRAATQAVEYYRKRLGTFVTKANNQYKRYYKQDPSRVISASELEPLLDEILASLPAG